MRRDPRIIGLVSFWDESPTWLAATIASLARFCDHAVVLDGRYALFPDNRLQSGSAEHYAAVDAARAAGLGLTLHTAPRTFPDEMEKRSHLFKLGMVEAEPLRDWFFVLDADEVVVESPSREEVHAHLAAGLAERDERGHTATFWERTDPHADEQRSRMSSVMPVEYRYEASTPRFWLAHHDMRVVGYHYNYVGEDEAGVTRELWGQDGLVDRVRWGSLCGRVVIENRNRLRAMVRDRDRQSYYEQRDKLGVETVATLAELEGVSDAAGVA